MRKFTDPLTRLALPCALLTAALSGCGNNISSQGPQNSASAPNSNYPTRSLTNSTSIPTPTGSNVVQITVDGSQCLPLPTYNANGQNTNGEEVYPNEPCVSVTICPPGSASSSDANCQTISGLLLDTGSVGLRVFSSALSTGLLNSLTAVSPGSGVLTECIMYGDGSADWGPVANATVFMGEESGANVPIQLIDASYGGSSASNGWQICNSEAGGSTSNIVLDQGSVDGTGLESASYYGAGFNGILGVGLTLQDCGSYCESSNANVNPAMYYSCTGTLSSSSSCSSSFLAVSTTLQVQNVGGALTADNNGEIIEMPQISGDGAASVNGYLVMGIGTESNNVPASGVMTFNSDPDYLEFNAQFNSQTYPSFIDSGSNMYYFPSGTSAGLVYCSQYDPSDFSGTDFYCAPSGAYEDGDSTLYLLAEGVNGVSANVPFLVGNLTYTFLYTSNWVFSNLGYDSDIAGQPYWDIGLPFYLGRNVYHGFEGGSSTLGSGTYWAF